MCSGDWTEKEEEAILGRDWSDVASGQENHQKTEEARNRSFSSVFRWIGALL